MVQGQEIKEMKESKGGIVSYLRMPVCVRGAVIGGVGEGVP